VIFVDTSFWVALRIPRDGRHGEATSLLRSVGEMHLVTSNHVRGETWTFLQKRAGHASAVACLEAIAASPRLDVVHISEDLEDAALAWLAEAVKKRRSSAPLAAVDPAFSTLEKNPRFAGLLRSMGLEAARR
jgi:predicted nucleic acid-binding protein